MTPPRTTSSRPSSRPRSSARALTPRTLGTSSSAPSSETRRSAPSSAASPLCSPGSRTPSRSTPSTGSVARACRRSRPWPRRSSRASTPWGWPAVSSRCRPTRWRGREGSTRASPRTRTRKIACCRWVRYRLVGFFWRQWFAAAEGEERRRRKRHGKKGVDVPFSCVIFRRFRAFCFCSRPREQKHS